MKPKPFKCRWCGKEFERKNKKLRICDECRDIGPNNRRKLRGGALRRLCGGSHYAKYFLAYNE